MKTMMVQATLYCVDNLDLTPANDILARTNTYSSMVIFLDPLLQLTLMPGMGTTKDENIEIGK